VNGNLVPESADEHVLECALVTINATEDAVEIEEGHESQPLLRTIDEDNEEEQEVGVAMSVDEPSDIRDVKVANETPHHLPTPALDMFEDDEFHISSQSFEEPLIEPASVDLEMREQQPTVESTYISNASPSDIPLYDDGNFEEVYAASITPPLRMVEHQFKQLHCNETPLEVHQPVTEEEVWRHTNPHTSLSI